MQGWYQFGYDGFPSGEARLRFYRQRDDPCDSEEEQEAYDGNDRPVYHYPMHESEEASSARDEDEIEEKGLLASLPSVSPSLLRVSAWDSFPGRCGCTAVPLKALNGENGKEGDAYFMLHGGVETLTWQVTNTSEVLRVAAHVNRVAGHEAFYVVEPDPLLAESICRMNLGSFSAAAERNSTSYATKCPPRRFGHSAAAVPCSSLYNMHPHFSHSNYELYLVLNIGGAFSDCVPQTLHNVHIRGSVMCEPWLSMTLLCGRGESRRENGSTASSSSSNAAGTTHWTVHFPLSGLPPFMATPRVFATLTAWPIAERDAETASYAYLGGSVNGWDPLPLFGLWLLHLDTTNWTLSTSLLETFGEEPPSRFGHSAVLVDSQELYVFGGIGARRTYLNDLVVLNCVTRVWREVFVPSLFSMPPRAFHSTVLMPHSATLLIIGGEAEGRHESSVWKYSLDRGVWSLMTFPLLDRTFSVFSGREHDSPATKRVVGATQLLCKRERLNAERGDTAGGVHLRRGVGPYSLNQSSSDALVFPQSLAPHSKACLPSCVSEVDGKNVFMTPLSSFYFAAMHGSLLQALRMDSGIMVFGGTKSPSVTSLSWIPARDYSLKESTALWICMYRVQPFMEMRLGARLHGGSDALDGLSEDPNGKREKGRVDLVERLLAEDQLEQWKRDARKRLRG